MSADHDPLCPSWWVAENGGRACRNCDLIARVVEREREVRIADAGNGVGHTFTCACGKHHDVTHIYVQGQRDERQKARQRVEALPGRANGAWLLWSDAVAAAGGDA
jgi:hypothetical protein